MPGGADSPIATTARSLGPIAPLSILLRVTAANRSSMRCEKLPAVAGIHPRDAAKRPNAASASTTPRGTEGIATVMVCGTDAIRFEVASGVKDDHVRDERVLVYSTDGSVPLPQPAR